MFAIDRIEQRDRFNSNEVVGDLRWMMRAGKIRTRQTRTRTTAAAWACTPAHVRLPQTNVVFKTPMLLRGSYGLCIARAVWAPRPDNLRKSIHSSVVHRKDSSNQNKLYAKSLLLPRTTFPQWTDPQKTEVQLRKETCDNLYRWQVRSKCRTFRAMPRTTDIGP